MMRNVRPYAFSRLMAVGWPRLNSNTFCSRGEHRALGRSHTLRLTNTVFVNPPPELRPVASREAPSGGVRISHLFEAPVCS
eukprot:8874357-Alexandrium_andersonii.AAC.1